MHTIGLLLPRSTFYETIGFDIFEGLKSGLGEHGDIRIITENIGFGTDKQQVYRCAEQLLLHENVQVVFAYIGHRTAQVLRPLFASANRLLIVLDSGAHLPQEWPASPNIYYHSLQNSLGAWLSSKRAISEGHKTAGMVTGYYDGGYLHTIGAYNGYVDAGGSVAFNIATGYQRNDFSMLPMKEQMSDDNSGCVLGIFSGDYVQWFFEDLKNHFAGQSPSVYLPPFAFEESMLKDAVFPGGTIRGIASWSENLASEQNTHFLEAMGQKGRVPNLFALLGWEAAQLAIFLTGALAEGLNPRAAGEKLKEFTFESPRGPVAFHAASHCSYAPMYKVSITDDGTGHCTLLVEGKIENVEMAYEDLFALDIENAVSGWYNSYTCI